MMYLTICRVSNETFSSDTLCYIIRIVHHSKVKVHVSTATTELVIGSGASRPRRRKTHLRSNRPRIDQSAAPQPGGQNLAELHRLHPIAYVADLGELVLAWTIDCKAECASGSTREVGRLVAHAFRALQSTSF